LASRLTALQGRFYTAKTHGGQSFVSALAFRYVRVSPISAQNAANWDYRRLGGPKAMPKGFPWQ